MAAVCERRIRHRQTIIFALRLQRRRTWSIEKLVFPHPHKGNSFGGVGVGVVGGAGRVGWGGMVPGIAPRQPARPYRFSRKASANTRPYITR